MKSETITIRTLFENRRQYFVPFYQRAYVWTREGQWEQLWDDIREKAEARLANQKATPHFQGAVVLEPQPRVGLVGVDVLHIIDGQQRLTSIIGRVNRAQIEGLHHIDHKTGQVIFREPVMQRSRQQQRLVQVVGAETLSHEQHFRKG